VIRTAVDGISRMGRSTQGVRLMNLRGDDQVSSIARVTEPTQPAVVTGDVEDSPGD
jgi:DNA gyrase subunit A